MAAVQGSLPETRHAGIDPNVDIQALALKNAPVLL